MGRRQQHVYHVEPSRFPPDFPERLDRLRREAGLSWRGLARALRVDTRMLRRWRNGTTPDSGHLYALVVFALERNLLPCLLPGAALLVDEAGAPAESLVRSWELAVRGGAPGEFGQGAALPLAKGAAL